MDHRASLRATLKQELSHAALAAGLTPDQTASYLLALYEYGILEPDKPDWLLKSALFRLEKGKRPELAHLKRLEWELETACEKWKSSPAASPLASKEEVRDSFAELKAE